jgi:hypothetical protein
MPAARAEIPIVVLSEASPTSPVSGATAVVKFRATGTEASVYENSGATETKLTQPLTTNSRGALTGWLPRGAYTVEITLPGKTPYAEFLDVVPGSDGAVEASWIANETLTLEKFAPSAKNAIAATPSLRSLGVGATEAAAGNDSRLTNERTPSTGSVTTAKIVDASVTEAKLANEAVSLNKLTTGVKNQLSTYATVLGVGSPKISRGSASIEVVQPGGQFQGQAAGSIFHGLGVTPASVQMLPIIGYGYTVLFDFRVYDANSSYFSYQVYSTQMPSERVNIGFYFVAFS